MTDQQNDEYYDSGHEHRRSRRSRGGSRRQHRAPRPVPIKDNPDTIRHLASIAVYRELRRRRGNKRTLIALVIVSAVAAYQWDEWGWFGAWAALMVTILVFGLHRGGSFSRSGYYNIPGSQDEEGRHVCIYCGGYGIYRHGQYKSNVRYADCSKCGANLWVE